MSWLIGLFILDTIKKWYLNITNMIYKDKTQFVAVEDLIALITNMLVYRYF